MERYEAYKDSGVEWIGEIPSSWNVQRFRWTLERVNRAPLEDDEIVTCFRDGEVTLRRNRREDGFTMSDKEIGYQHICAGDFVIHGMDGFAGAMGISDSDGKASPVLMAFQPIGSQDLRYINYLLRLYAWRNVFLALSTTIRVRSCDLNWAKVAPLPLVLPSFNEQQAIADYLDARTAEVDALVADCEQEVELLREYRKAVISEAVTKGLDPDAPIKNSGIEWIGEIPKHWSCENLGGHSWMLTPMRDKPEDLTGPIPWVRIEDYDGKYISASKEELGVSAATVDAMNLKVYPVGTLLCTSSCDLGKCAIVAKELVSNQRFIGIIPTDYDVDYLYYLMLSNAERLNFLSTGTIQANLSRKSFEHLKLPYPPYSEQTEIAIHLDAKTAEIDSLIEAKQTMADELREYRRSLISEAVTGKFKVPGADR